MLRWLVILIKGTGWLLVAMGLVAFCAPFPGGANPELPLGDLQGLAVDREGRIHVGLGYHRQIQVYDADGAFIRNWGVDTEGGSFKLRMNARNQLEVATARGRKFHVFSTDGKLLHSESDAQNRYDELKSVLENTCSTPDGRTLRIEGGMLSPRVVRIVKGQHPETIITTPWRLWFLMAPLPAFLFLMGGGLLLFFSDQRTLTKLREFREYVDRADLERQRDA